MGEGGGAAVPSVHCANTTKCTLGTALGQVLHYAVTSRAPANKTVQSCPGGCGSVVGLSSPAQKGVRFEPWSGHIREATNQCFSLTLMFLSLLSSLSNINKSLGEYFLKSSVLC